MLLTKTKSQGGFCMETFRSVCPYDCPDTCGLLIEVDKGKVVKVKGDPMHPFTRGTLCPKMAHYEKTVYSPLRLKTPLLRTGKKGNGVFRPISWQEAIRRIAEQWKEIIGKQGAETILPYSYAGTMGIVQRHTGQAFFHRLGAARLDRTICAPAKGCGWESVMGNTLSIRPQECAESDFIILWGIHAVATNIHFLQDVRKAQAKGGRVWVIDTYENLTAKNADRFIAVRPGTDGALALGMMHVILKENLADKAFLAEYTAGYEKLAKLVLAEYAPEQVAEITGVSVKIIEEVARAYALAKAPFIRLGSGLSRYTNGAMTVRTIVCLPAFVGAWKKRGGGLLASVPTSRILDKKVVVREDFLPYPTRRINMVRLGDALLDAKQPLYSLYVYHSNPAAVAPDQNKVLEGLKREDLFTVVHERFMTDTAKYADIVLPAVTSLEQSDVYCAYGNYGLQQAKPVLPSQGEAKSNWEVFQLLAKAMGMEDQFFTLSADALVSLVSEKARDFLTERQWEEFTAGKPVEWLVDARAKMKFCTPSGKIELYNPAEEETLPHYIPPHGDKGDFWFINAPDPRLLNSSFNERAELQRTQNMKLLMHAEDAQALSLQEGDLVTAWNDRGEVRFWLECSFKIPHGVVVTEGVWWLSHAPGNRSVNALTSQRITDKGAGSTFYDVRVYVKKTLTHEENSIQPG
jgi:anaerobic selenocysteine-containing dehydrogenase